MSRTRGHRRLHSGGGRINTIKYADNLWCCPRRRKTMLNKFIEVGRKYDMEINQDIKTRLSMTGDKRVEEVEHLLGTDTAQIR